MIYAISTEGRTTCEVDTRVFELRRLGRPYPVEPQVFDLLLYLLEHRDRVVFRAELLEHLWSNRIVSDTTVSHCVMEARKALGDSGHTQRIIKTCHRRGYRFVAEVDVRQQTYRDVDQHQCILTDAPAPASPTTLPY